MAKFREFISKKGTLILAGKNAENNEELVSQIAKDEEVFHTAKPGSPFVNIKGIPKQGDIKEAAIFCARYSQDWRDNKKDVTIHRFKGRDIYKIKSMEKGTFGIKKYKPIAIKRDLIEKFNLK
jgi:predicted ribosome quality control (RQC) complex YloA/Tae2 family protein